MNRFVSFALVVWAIIMAAGVVVADDQQQPLKSPDGLSVFPASRGDVVFDHDAHQSRMTGEGCQPCHKTQDPTTKAFRTRIDARIAHYFCKGCHREKGKGPVECYGCHNAKTVQRSEAFKATP